MSDPAGDRWLLAHHVGSLGDTIVTIPALRAVRAEWPSHRVALLTTSGARLTARDVLDGDGLVDAFLVYDRALSGPRLVRETWRVARWLRQRRFSHVVSLLPSERAAPAHRRDRWFFRACGIRTVYGYGEVPGDVASDAREDRRKLRRLAAAGIRAARAPHDALPLLVLRPEEIEAGTRLAAPRPGRPLVAMGLTANWPSKHWPLERFAAIGRRLNAAGAEVLGVGGPADHAAFESLRAGWGFGVNACGHPPRITAAALARCRAFLGVDSGSAHLAASVGTPCVVVAWAGMARGQWDPIGTGHAVIRLDVPCGGCRAERCGVAGHPCLTGIAVDPVWEALSALLRRA